MLRPVLLKLGGSVLTDKSAKPRFKKTVARRLLSEVAKADVPAVVAHGAGSFGHPAAKHYELGSRAVTPERRQGVSATLAGVGQLHAEVAAVGVEAGLQVTSVPLHLTCTSRAGELSDLPVDLLQELLEEGFTPVLSGTLVRDDRLGWRVLSADEIMRVMAAELEPRLAVFATDVAGVSLGPGSEPVPVLGVEDLDKVVTWDAPGDDVTGGMRGKLEHAFHVAAHCPTWIVDGTVRGRLHHVLRGKTVPGTRLQV